MNQEIKAKWIAALRSGNYEQGKGALLDIKDKVKRYCCLGVLCDLYSKEINEEWVVDDSLNGFILYKNQEGVLPNCVQKWAELPDADPNIYDPSRLAQDDSHEFFHIGSLSSLNDGGLSFLEIADLIEKFL